MGIDTGDIHLPESATSRSSALTASALQSMSVHLSQADAGSESCGQLDRDLESFGCRTVTKLSLVSPL